MSLKLPVFKTLFTFEESQDPSVEDDQWVLKSNPTITIQVCPYAGGYAVNEFNEEEGMMYDHGMFKTLKSAAVKALEVA